MRIRLLFPFILIAFTIWAPLCSASDKEGCDDGCGQPTAWNDFNKFQLKMTVPGNPQYSIWNGQFDTESHDIQIDVENFDGTKIAKGKILMIGGRVMAVQGPITEPGYEIDALDGAVLELQLLMRLLGAALPKGPTEVQGERRIDFLNEKTGIKFATPSADGFIPAPWRVRGEVRSLGTDAFGYQLTLTFTAREKPSDKGEERTMTFSGELSKTTSARISDSLPLDGWKLLGVGVQVQKDASGTTADYSAAPAAVAYKTVADVRAELAKENYVGEPDPSKDFTGFWKDNCEDAWGVSIEHHGSDGKYSIVFCGPGGCGDPGEGRLTYITKDPRFQVVSEDEIKRRMGDQWETQYRCTKDPHPVLKYKEACRDGGPVPPPARGSDWEVVRSVSSEGLGTIRLVLIPEAKQRDREYYKQIGEMLCPVRTKCSVKFWTDRNHIPESEWMPVKDLAVMTASYTSNPCEKESSLHLACWLYPTKAAGKAEHCSVEPGAKVPEK